MARAMRQFVGGRLGEADPARVEAARVYAAQQRALDIPFEAMQRQRVLGTGTGRERGAQRRAATGLVPIQNKGNANAFEFPGAGLFVRRGKVLIDGHARRMKRMRTVVEHSLRLAESGLAHSGGFRFRRLLVTLTYADVHGWQANHFGSWIRRAREWAKRRGFALKWTWVAELQARGAVHYHVCFWIPAREFMPASDLNGWWTHGSTNVKAVHGGVCGVIGYLGKYLTKGGSKQSMDFPKGARMYGAGGLESEQRREIRYRSAPFWVRDAMGTFADIRRALGGWVDRVTGLFVPSPWKIEICGCGFVWAFKPAV